MIGIVLELYSKKILKIYIYVVSVVYIRIEHEEF